MTLTKRTALLCVVLLVFAALAVVFGMYDLQISLALVNQESPFGLTLETLGVLVAPMIATCASIVTITFFVKEKEAAKRKQKIVFSALAAAIGIGYTVYVFLDFAILECLLYLLATLLIYAAVALLVQKLSRETLYTFMRISVVALWYLVTILVAILVIKTFWGRIRYRQMEDISQFVPWFIPQGITGFNSFPSGHTSNATSVYLLTMFAPLTKNKFLKALCWIAPIVWIIVMAVSRVIVGAHYASDVLFGAGISIALFYLVKHIVLKKIRPLA